MERNITAQEVQAGFDSGLIHLIDADNEPYCGIGVACEIGSGFVSNWFYFAGWEGENMTAAEYMRDIPMETIVDEIVRVLDDFQHGDEVDHDEWLFYRYLIDKYQGGLSMAKYINGQRVTAFGFGFDGCHKFYLIENEDDCETLREYGYRLYKIDGLPRAWADSCPLRFIDSADLTKTWVPQCTPAYFTGDWNIDAATRRDLEELAQEWLLED